MKKSVIVICLFTFLLIGNVFAKKVEIAGIENKEIVKLIKDNVSFSVKKYRSISSEDSISIEYRIKKDNKLIKNILDSFGYFEAEINPSYRDETFFIDIKLRERYKISEGIIQYNMDSYYLQVSDKLPKTEDVFKFIGLKKGSYIHPKEISNTITLLVEFYKSQGFVFARVEKPKLVRNKEKKVCKIIFEVKLNKKIVITSTKISINNKKLENFIKNRILWKSGDFYTTEICNRTRNKIMESGIFSSVEIRVDENGSVTIHAEEAKPRDIQVGISYSGIEKLGASFSWKHHNIDGKGANLSSTTVVSNKLQSEKLKYNMYDLFFKRDELKNQIYGVREHTVSYKVIKAGGESIMWNEIPKLEIMKFGIGVSAESSKTEDKVIQKGDKYTIFNAIGIPFGLSIDNTDEYLDPYSGVRGSIMVTPYISEKKFTILNTKFAFYIPILENEYSKKVVIAGYAKIGNIFHSFSQKKVLPRDKLFFGGGNNSIRGYGYQMLGSLSKENKPLGGLSTFEFVIEPRVKITENIGVAIFLEGGNVFNNELFSKNLMYSGGIGIRYYTPLGPLRFDIAFPFNRRKEKDGKYIDSWFRVYVSIGQAF